MNTHDIFSPSPASTPLIYAYRLLNVPSHEGFIKIGMTTRTARERIDEQTKTSGVKYEILLEVPALRDDGSAFRDKDVHNVLAYNGFVRMDNALEWFMCSADDVREAIYAVRNRTHKLSRRINEFKMRPEQSHAVRMTQEYFLHSGHTPKFLWNAKMRFGKTFAAYQLCKRMGFTKILIITYKPAVEDSWEKDIDTHKDFEGWQFISNHTASAKGMRIDDEFECRRKNDPVVVFGSFQDLLGTNSNGGIKAKNGFIHSTEWDIAIFDEYHFGAWRENARNLFRSSDDESDIDSEYESAGEDFNDDSLPITARYKLYLSGTPFRALNSGEFIEEQIYSWTYTDEQRAKEKWRGSNNPYASMPGMIMMTYQIPESIRKIAEHGEFDGFDLNEFFSCNESGFVYEDYVRKWLLLIRGAYLPFEKENLKRDKRPPMPFSDSRLLENLKHTVWFLPDVASCKAMKRLLESDLFFRDYRIVLCAGSECGNGVEALVPLNNALKESLRTITLTCGKLLTGVTVPAWSGIFMLRNLKSPETYFQAAFRVQSPFTLNDDNGSEIILKDKCYIFDFALERALKQIADYSCRLNLREDDPEKKAEEFMNFLPVLAFDGGSMKQLDASDVLDFAVSGTSASMLARRWKSALLVNVNTETISRILSNEPAMKIIESIESFRAMKEDMTDIINITKQINDNRKSDDTSKRTAITEAEKERRKKIHDIQEKLMKFLIRIPIFMYLTDEREISLVDIIDETNPELFKRITGIKKEDFETLNSLGLFNSELMNEAIYNFKRYEDSSLSYVGYELNDVSFYGGFDEVKKREEFYEER